MYIGLQNDQIPVYIVRGLWLHTALFPHQIAHVIPQQPCILCRCPEFTGQVTLIAAVEKERAAHKAEVTLSLEDKKVYVELYSNILLDYGQRWDYHTAVFWQSVKPAIYKAYCGIISQQSVAFSIK